MLKSFLVIVVLLITVSFAHSELVPVEVTHYCNDYRTVISNVTIDFEERAVFEAYDDNSVTFLFVNTNTGTWTILKSDIEKNFACLIAEGTSYFID